MGRLQRTRGMRYENEVAQTISRALDGIPVSRKLGQARDSGNDISVGPLDLECKRRRTLTTLEGWMEQAEAATPSRPLDDPHYPVVVARADNCESMAIMRLDDFLHFIKPELLRRMRATANVTNDTDLKAALVMRPRKEVA